MTRLLATLAMGTSLTLFSATSLAQVQTGPMPVRSDVSIVSDVEGRSFEVEIRRDGTVIDRCRTPCHTVLEVGNYSLVATGSGLPLITAFRIRNAESRRLVVGADDWFAANMATVITAMGIGATAVGFDNLAYAVLPGQTYVTPYVAQLVGTFQRDLALFTGVAIVPAAALLVWRGTNLTLESKNRSVIVQSRALENLNRVQYQSFSVSGLPGGGLVSVTFNF